MMIRGEVRTGNVYLGVSNLHLLAKIQNRILGILSYSDRPKNHNNQLNFDLSVRAFLFHQS